MAAREATQRIAYFEIDHRASTQVKPLPVRAPQERFLPTSSASGTVAEEEATQYGELRAYRRLIGGGLIQGVQAAHTRMNLLGLKYHESKLWPAPGVKVLLRLQCRGPRTALTAILLKGGPLVSDCWSSLRCDFIRLGYFYSKMVVAALPKLGSDGKETPVFHARAVKSLAEPVSRRRERQPTGRSAGARAILHKGRLDFSWCNGVLEAAG